MKDGLTIAVLESVKPNEARIPLHSQHFSNIQQGKNKLVFQTHYAQRFGQQDHLIKNLGFAVLPRDELLKTADVIFLLKPILDDLTKMKPGAVLIGWCHAVQQVDVVRIAKEKKLTLIAMEAMYRIADNKRKHLFQRNNFMTGSLGVEHALACVSLRYSQQSKVAIITYGTVGQGAAAKLVEKGFSNITVFSRRPLHAIANQLPEVTYETIEPNGLELRTTSGSALKERLLNSDIIINGIMQDVLNPYQFFSSEDLKSVCNKLIIDLSCDEKMGFDFARATSIDEPILKLGKNFYYAVDHIPTLAWKTISVNISKQLLPFVNAFLQNKFDRELDTIIKQATEVREGEIINPTIIQYQKQFQPS